MQQHIEPFRTCERCSPQHKKVLALNGPVSWVVWRLHVLCDCMGSLDSSHSRRRCECNSVNSCLSLCDGPAIDWQPSQGVPRLLSYHSWAPAPNHPPSNSCSTELKRVDWRDGSKYYFREIKFWMRTLANKVQLLFVNHCAFSYLGTSGPAHHHFMSTSIFSVCFWFLFVWFFF